MPLKYLICPLKYLICALKSSRRRARLVEAANNNWLWSLCTRSAARKVWTGEQLQLEQSRSVMLGHRDFETQSDYWWIYDALDLDTPNQCWWAFASLRHREDKEKILQNIQPGSKRRCASTRWTTRSRRRPRSSASTTRRSAAGWRSRRSRTSAQTSATSSEKKVGYSRKIKINSKSKNIFVKVMKRRKTVLKRRKIVLKRKKRFSWSAGRDLLTQPGNDGSPGISAGNFHTLLSKRLNRTPKRY